MTGETKEAISMNADLLTAEERAADEAWDASVVRTGTCAGCEATEMPLNANGDCRMCDDIYGPTKRDVARQCFCGTCDRCAFKIQMLWERDPWPGYVSRYVPPKREGGKP
jgi:hypothetical protein